VIPKNPDLAPVPPDMVVLLMQIPRTAMGSLVDVLRALPPGVADAIRVSVVSGIGPYEPEPARPDPTPDLWCHCETSTDDTDGGFPSD
jgi:hypothetical protein